MEYEYFIGMVKQYESEYINAYAGNLVCSAITRIPKPFGLLVRDILAILERNISLLCSVDSQTIIITGFQPAGFMIRSSTPRLRKRVIDQQREDQHFCCTFEYQVVAKGEPAKTWERTQSVVVDFTTGEIMDNACYLSRLITESERSHSGHLLGKINKSLLDTVWQMVRTRQRSKLAQVA